MEHHDGDDGDGDDVDQSLDVSYPMFKQKQTNLFFFDTKLSSWFWTEHALVPYPPGAAEGGHHN